MRDALPPVFAIEGGRRFMAAAQRGVPAVSARASDKPRGRVGGVPSPAAMFCGFMASSERMGFNGSSPSVLVGGVGVLVTGELSEEVELSTGCSATS